MSAFAAQVPGFHDGRDMFGCPVYGKGPSVHQYQNDIRIDRVDGLEQFLLQARQIQKGPAAAFTRLEPVFPEYHDDRFCIPCQSNRFRDTAAVARIDFCFEDKCRITFCQGHTLFVIQGIPGIGFEPLPYGNC